jgi:pSer/pThr/pTyr-binding forkhead associated (FHA) protein
LFDEPAPVEQTEEPFNNTESNIKELLELGSAAEAEQKAPAPAQEATPSASAASMVAASKQSQHNEDEDVSLPSPEEQDYFQQDQVNESSFHMAREEESITSSKKASPEAADRRPLTPNPEKPVNRDDSISHILDSIHLDDEDGAGKPAAASGATPSVQTEFKLIMTQGDLDSNVFAVRDNTSIGRSPSNDVVLKEPKVSRQHAAINKYNDHYIMIDLKSSNGVYVNGAKVDECVLHPGDEISIGGYKFVFQKN